MKPPTAKDGLYILTFSFLHQMATKFQEQCLNRNAFLTNQNAYVQPCSAMAAWP
jgi:hypothetical protein